MSWDEALLNKYEPKALYDFCSQCTKPDCRIACPKYTHYCREAAKRYAGMPVNVSKLITIKGESHSLTDWARIRGIRQALISQRIARGWNEEKAVMAPPRRPTNKTGR